MFNLRAADSQRREALLSPVLVEVCPLGEQSFGLLFPLPKFSAA